MNNDTHSVISLSFPRLNRVERFRTAEGWPVRAEGRTPEVTRESSVFRLFAIHYSLFTFTPGLL